MPEIHEILSGLPMGFLKLGADNHAQNMANFSLLVNAKEGGVGDPKAPAKTTAEKFGDWTDSNGDTKIAAKSLMDLGLIGADQVFYEKPDISTRSGVINSQSDWKPAAIEQILQNAYKLGIRKPEEVMANKDVLIGNPRFRDAINNPVFAQIHPNFWQVITEKLLPQQYAKFDKQNKN